MRGKRIIKTRDKTHKVFPMEAVAVSEKEAAAEITETRPNGESCLR
jgi:hypothetical protein